MHKMINTKYYKGRMNVPYGRMRGLSLNGECKTKVISHTHNSTAGVTFLTLQTTPDSFTTPCYQPYEYFYPTDTSFNKRLRFFSKCVK